jgi:catechol 2,3-dioxygenase-like lactoylglutathione lyase family enzyme
VADLDRAVGFYRDVLGFELRLVSDGARMRLFALATTGDIKQAATNVAERLGRQRCVL